MLPHSRLVLNGFPDNNLRRKYRDRVNGTLQTKFLTDPVAVQLETFNLGPLGVIVFDTSARRSERDAAQVAADGYDAVGVQFVISGRARIDTTAGTAIAEPGTVTILDFAQPFTVTDEDHRIVINVVVPRALFPVSGNDPWSQHGKAITPSHGRLLAAFMGCLYQDHANYRRTAGPMLGRAFLELLSVSQDIDDPGEPEVPFNKHSALIARAEKLVELRIASPDLTPAWLAGKLGLSRSQLYLTFQPFGGVAQFILRRRLAAAHAALSNPADLRRIGEIGYACGFATDAHFAKAFRARYGVTATSVRRSSSGHD